MPRSRLSTDDFDLPRQFDAIPPQAGTHPPGAPASSMAVRPESTDTIATVSYSSAKTPRPAAHRRGIGILGVAIYADHQIRSRFVLRFIDSSMERHDNRQLMIDDGEMTMSIKLNQGTDSQAHPYCSKLMRNHLSLRPANSMLSLTVTVRRRNWRSRRLHPCAERSSEPLASRCARLIAQ